MAQVHDATTISLYRAGSSRGGVVRRLLEAASLRLRALLTDGLVADAFLVLDGNDSVGVLLRRSDGYVLVARHEALSQVDGSVYAEPDFARDVSARLLTRPVSLSPVWYS